MDVVKKVRYDSAFTFIYSKRTGTPAAAMENQVPEDVVKDRFDRLLKEVQSISAEVCSVHEGTTQSVPGEKELIGKIVSVRLDACKGFYYIGTRV